MIERKAYGTLVEKELRAGRKLLLAQQTANLGDVGCVRRELDTTETSGQEAVHDGDEGGDDDRFDPRIEYFDTDDELHCDNEGMSSDGAPSSSGDQEDIDWDSDGAEDKARQRYLPPEHW